MPRTGSVYKSPVRNTRGRRAANPPSVPLVDRETIQERRIQTVEKKVTGVLKAQRRMMSILGPRYGLDERHRMQIARALSKQTAALMTALETGPQPEFSFSDRELETTDSA